METRVIILAVVALMIGLPTAVGAATLPPEVVAPLSAERDRADGELAVARRELGAAVAAHRTASGHATRLRWYASRFEGVLDSIGMELEGTEFGRASIEAGRELDRAEVRLEAATKRTATAQGRALDADRRLRALQRASATADQRDPGIGSWRFGSGGPGVSAESIDRYLESKGSPLVGQGAAFLESGVEHEVDPRLLVAIAGAESYFGIVTCADFNAWGWGCPTSPFRFRDWPEAIDTVTLGLREGYLDDGLDSVGEIHLRYAPPNAANDPTGLNFAWPDNVARFLVEQGGDPQDVAGVLGPSR